MRPTFSDTLTSSIFNPTLNTSRRPAGCTRTFADTSRFLGNSGRRAVAWTWLALLALVTPCTAVAVDPTYIAALYYDQSSKLLQIENLRNLASPPPNRTLFDTAGFPVPQLTSKPTLKPACKAEGQSQKMSNKARFAIYYVVDDPSNATERARAYKVEDVVNVKDRNIACEQINDDHACAAPKRCPYTCLGCATWCCI